MNLFNRIIHVQYKLYQKGCRLRIRCGGGMLLLFNKLIYKYIRIYYHCDIPYNLDLTGVYFCHSGFSIVINPYAKIGKGTYIQHGVTIGARDDKGETDAPKIGEDCYIGARAIIIGNIEIGDNCKIGAGAVVVNDIPSNCTAIGIPAKIIKHGDKKT